MDPTATADTENEEGTLAREMRVTFDTDEMASFFDGFLPLDPMELLSNVEG